jgi:hypothetical protein
MKDSTRSGRAAVENVCRMHSWTEKCLIADGARNLGEPESEVGTKNCIFLAMSIKYLFKVYMHPKHEVVLT